MELKLIDDKGAAGTMAAKDEIFGRDFNEALVHQLVVSYAANARLATSKQKDRGEVRHSTKKPWRQKGTGRARAGMTSSPLWRGGGKIFPNTTQENYAQKVNRKMYRAGMASILSQLAREDRIRVVEEFKVPQPKTKLLAQKVKSMGFSEVLVITDEMDSNLTLSSRNLPNVEVIAAKQANPVALVRYPTRAAHQGRAGQARGDVQMTAAKKYNADQLMTVLLAPVVSEKSTRVADKNRQYVFRVADEATKPEIKAAVELLFKTKVDSVTVSRVKGKQKRFGRFMGRRNNWKKAYVRLAVGQEINFAATE